MGCRTPNYLLISSACAIQGFVAVRGLRVPVVCAVHGSMIGGAAAIFLHADLRVAESEATFQHGNLSRGLFRHRSSLMHQGSCLTAHGSCALWQACALLQGTHARCKLLLVDRTLPHIISPTRN